MKSSIVLQTVLSLVSGVLLAASFPPWNFSWLVWIAFAPVLAGILILPGSRLIALIQGSVFSASFGLITFYWLGSEGRINELILNVGTLVVVGAIWGWFVRRFAVLPEFRQEKDKKKRLEPILVGSGRSAEAWAGSGAHLRIATVIASSWTGLEWARGFLLPVWNQAGTAVGDNLALLQLVKVTGPSGLTFLVVFANTILLANVRRLFLQPGRMNWAGRFDVTSTLAILLLIAAAGFWSLRSAPAPKGLKVCTVASSTTDLARLTDLSLVAPATQSDLVVWRRILLHSGDYQVLSKASLGQTIGLIAGTASSPAAPLTGYEVFTPGSVRSVFALSAQPLFQLMGNRHSRNDQAIVSKDTTILPFLGLDAGSFELLRAASQKQIQCFVALFDQPSTEPTEEEQLKRNLRVWTVALGRPLVFNSRRAGAFLVTRSGRIAGSVEPETEGATVGELDPPIGVDSSPYAVYGDWFPIVAAVLAVLFALSEALKKSYAQPGRFHS